MAEALGLASSIVALVQLSASVYSATSKFYREAKEAKSKIHAIATQTRNLSGVLQNLSLLISSPLFDEAGVSCPSFRNTYIESCHTTLHRIKRKLEAAEADFETGSRRKLIKHSLKWPFASQETSGLIEELGQHCAVLQLALSADTMSHLLQCLANTSTIAKSVEALNQKLVRKENIDARAELTANREKIKKSFLEVNPEGYLQDCRSRRQPSTGKWLIERNETFRNWINTPGSQIWLSGIPGAGKTILCGAVIDEILQEQTTSIAVAFFFCDYKNSQSQSPVNVLGAIAIQLATQADAAFEVLDTYHNELHPHNGIKKPPEVRGLIQVIRKMMNHYDRVYIAVDGIDECASHVVELLQSLKQLTQGEHVNMALFSRDESDISEELSDSSRIEISAHTEDLELYVLAQMESRRRLGSLAVKNPELHEHIRQTLIGGANGMFRWVACQLDYLDGLPSDGRRRKALTELPPSLFETYDRILDRIMQEDKQNQELCRKALHWIALSYEQIDPLALCEAISIPDNQDIVDKELMVDPEWISRSCSSLIRLAGPDSRYSHFQLAHFTVKEYLRSIKPGSNRDIFRFSEDEAVRTLTRTSLRFLTFSIFDRTPVIASSEIQRVAQRNEQHPFYPVAAGYMFCFGGDYWDEDVGDELSLLLEDPAMMDYAKRLFSPRKTPIFLSWVLQAMWSWPDLTLDELDFIDIIGLLVSPEFSTLHLAAILALPSICTHLIDAEKVDLNMCCRLGTPLHALLAGSLYLFPTGFEYDPTIHYRLRATSKMAAYNESQKCLEIFVERHADTSLLWGDANVFQMALNNTIRTVHQKLWLGPLIIPSTVVNESCIRDFKAELAIGSIDRSILDAIFTSGFQSEISSGWARLASLVQTKRMEEVDGKSGQASVGLEVKTSDEDFTDAVRISIDQNLTDTLEVLVQDPRFRPDIYLPLSDSGSMPILHFAIRAGSPKLVKLLLGAGCDPKVVDVTDGWTALHQCAWFNRDDAANAVLFLGSRVMESTRNDIGETCWHVAAEKGNIPVLKALIERGCDTERSLATISTAGRSPLASAILNGEEDTALLLLDHCSLDLDTFQSDQSLLDEAAAYGSDELFRRLHGKLKDAGATEALKGAKPLENINMMCSPELVGYLMSSFSTGENKNFQVLQNYLLDANNALYDDPEMYPFRSDLEDIVKSLLPLDNVLDDGVETSQHFWLIFCKKVVPNWTRTCDHKKSHCRASLIGMIFGILIELGVLDSYEQRNDDPSLRPLLQSLVDREHHLRCAWIAPAVRMVTEVQSKSSSITNAVISTELLSHAMRQSNIDLARQLLDHGVGVHTTFGVLSPVEQACYSSELPIFHLLISRSDKTCINTAGGQGKSLLHWAVSSTIPGYLTKIQTLLRLGASINAPVDDPNRDTALTLASRSFRQDIVALLISEGADSLHRGRDGWSVLHAAAFTGDIRYIQSLLHSEIPNSFWIGTCELPLVHVDGRQHLTQKTAAIHLAASAGRSSFLRFMAQSHIPFDINAVTGDPFLTPLHLASLNGHMDFVDLLLSFKADLNAKDAYGRLPIDLAAGNGRLGVIKMLLKSGSKKPFDSFSGAIALMLSKETDCEEIGDDFKVMSLYHFEKAIVQGDLNRCKEVVACGHSINAELLTHSYTPLVRAVVEGQAAIVDWLVSSAVEVRNPVAGGLHPSLRCIVSLATRHISSPDTLSALMSLALRQGLSWYGSILSPLHVAILDNKTEALETILKCIRENDHKYRRMIDTELVCVPASILNWRGRAALSIFVSAFNKEESFSGTPPWREKMPRGSPLHWAIQKGDIPAVKLLLENDAQLNEVDSLGRSPLQLAVSSKHAAELTRELLQAGAGRDDPVRCGRNAMWLALRIGNLEVVKLLAEVSPETLKALDQRGLDALIRIAGSAAVFQYLVSQGADPYSVVDFPQSAATLHAEPQSSMRGLVFNSDLVSQCPQESLAFTLSKVASVGGASSIYWIKQLHHALSTGVFARIANHSRSSFASPLCEAASQDDARIVEALIAMGAELNTEGCRYGSPLMTASALGCLKAVKCLVWSGALLSYQNEHGLPRSAHSLSARHEKVMRWLLVDRHVEQPKLEYQPSQSTTQQAAWCGPRLFKLALPAYMHRDIGESSWGHLRRLQKWREGLRGSTLAESRRDSGLDFTADYEAESRKREAQAAQNRFLESLGEV